MNIVIEIKIELIKTNTNEEDKEIYADIFKENTI